MNSDSPRSEGELSSMPSGRRQRLSEFRWRELIELYGRSGQSASSFCSAQGVSDSSFYKWRRRFAEQEPAGDGQFVRLDPTCAPSDRVEAVLPSGIVVRAPASCLSELVRLVYRDTAC